MKLFDRMFTVFFARQNPDSTSPKPRFMKNTRHAVINTQTVSMPTFKSAGVCANAGVAASADSINPVASNPGNFLLIVPPWTEMNAERRAPVARAYTEVHEKCHCAQGKIGDFPRKSRDRPDLQIQQSRRSARVHLQSCTFPRSPRGP